MSRLQGPHREVKAECREAGPGAHAFLRACGWGALGSPELGPDWAAQTRRAGLDKLHGGASSTQALEAGSAAGHEGCWAVLSVLPFAGTLWLFSCPEPGICGGSLQASRPDSVM